MVYLFKKNYLTGLLILKDKVIVNRFIILLIQ